MEMEVVVAVPSAPVDFNFDSSCSSPYITAPSSPQRFGNFFLSEPTSPTPSSSAFFRECNDASVAPDSPSSVPFAWEETSRSCKLRNGSKNMNRFVNVNEDFGLTDDGDFEFDFSGRWDRTSLSADELFDGGKIRPLKPPTGYDSSISAVSSPRSSSPRSSNSKKKKDFSPFQASLEETRHGYSQQQQRGRKRAVPSSSSSSSSNYVRKGSRSLSPLRVSDLILDQEEENNPQNNGKIIPPTATTANPKSSHTSYASTLLSAISFTSKGYKKWKLKDLLLFRSASEGRDPLTKYEVLSKREVSEDVKNASFRSTESSIGGSSRRVSAHELHYKANRAVSEEMKRKTFLPYKQGLLGCLGFNPGVHEISRGIGSLTRG